MALFKGKSAARLLKLEEENKKLLEENKKLRTRLEDPTEDPEADPKAKKSKARSAEEDPETDPEEEDPEVDPEAEDPEAEEEDPETDPEEEDPEADPKAAKPKAAKASQANPSNATVMRELKSIRKLLSTGDQKKQAAALSSQIGIPPVRRSAETEGGRGTMKRTEWSAMSPKNQKEFFAAGGKLTD